MSNIYLPNEIRDEILLNYSYDEYEGCSLFALFYDSTNDDYMFVVVNHVLNPPTWDYEYESNHVHLLSLKTNKWSMIKEFQYRFFLNATATLVNGSPHWMEMCDPGKK